ncbi:uncharacterized protein LOC122504708 [Leptopilina heterotoma]|uniref:uncharacterized protein LOC122504708 n=1 Tax=Leptopilina heterotoma TaxID=63436 RepID=UPI001CA94DF5|nr:uncharacterized protein LOC122504708 [Leptopilina heterotoma]
MPEAALAIVNDSYVDDFLKSVDTENESVTMIKQVSFINEQGGFNMHSWSCNSPEVLKSIPGNQRDSNDKTKEDVFLFNVGIAKIPPDILHEERPSTKRKFLRIIIAVFDPLGFLAPFIIHSKILMQEVWVSGIEWDAPLGDNENKLWKSWIKDLPNTVLLWNKSDPRPYQTFVSHRLGEIADLTDPTDWRWVPSNKNPADDATRVSVILLHENHRWYSGPSFLRSEESDWPRQTFQQAEDTNIEQLERKKAQVLVMEQTRKTCTPDPGRFSKWIRLLRSMAWVLVAVKKLKELRALNSKKHIANSSRLKNLTPFVDENDLLCVRGRVNVDVDSSFNSYPPILDGKHIITRLLVHSYHEKANHGSPNLAINEMRQRYWIVNLRNALRSVTVKYQVCKIKKGKPTFPIMADLPTARLGYRQRPFTHCGLDYFGPLIVKIGRRREKRWVARFTCLTTRAIHLEIVHSASTDSAIMAIRRMIARRGQPAVLYSDNGRNFVGANNKLRTIQKDLNFDKQSEFVTGLGIKWHFIPPDAPHMGGAWERLVRSVKTALYVTLKEQVPKEKVFITFLAEAEHSVNSRPLTHVSLNPRDQEALTPNHFLLRSSSGGDVFSRFNGISSCSRKQWCIAQSYADSFWKRWLKEYLPTLLPKSKWTAETDPLKVGDVVIVIAYSSPRNL